MSEAEITVVVPAYNVAGYVGSCLASLVAQSLGDWRCIVVDDGSLDDTVACVERLGDPRIRVMRQANAGVSAARNAGLAEVQTPFVMFLDGDDLLHPTGLERLRAGFADARDAAATFGALRKVMDDGSPYPWEKPLVLARYPEGDVLAHMIRENFLANGGHVLVRTAAAQRTGGFDTRLRLSEDWEFWCRLAASGPFVFIGAIPEVFYLRMRPGSASGGLASEWSNHLAAVQTVLSNRDLQSRFSPTEWRRMERQVWASHLWEAGRVNFTVRRFRVARALMLRSLRGHPRPKRLALFAIALVSQLVNRSLVSRLRFREDDEALNQSRREGSAEPHATERSEPSQADVIGSAPSSPPSRPSRNRR